MKLDKESIIELLNQKGVEVLDLYPNQISVNIKKDNLLNHLVFLRSIGFDHLSFINAVDFIDEGEFELVYHVWSYTHKIHVLNKVRISRNNPVIPTIVNLWEQAQFYEQEIHEFFGIIFEGNKDLSPLFLENWVDIPPLRKDFDTKEFSVRLFGAEIRR
ncbi:NADH-quinone oxidoreductase subunit C [Thermoanaerobacter thermohydrosulfuricus]|uniref:NADH dehydrogenase (Ubiquinone) 30 kDa subunit n=3 Tax=Thermoanaerobacter TaxID=1754 RepID=G2MUN5_9THEO|nr:MULTISPECIES: NADH-quinone oxidoreductase subunit C [Thermoanaerobacter]EGD52032.1 NADH dehydrogenase (ubiquinone) 30 kDa subunit [Thermoanaerobacter ethanolicus JW 200]AEM77558.1 NADH dehydrogenase (ubiquinone) 30 kDa subunit [Thermoanaerobacter wiegelii Rt8.B1]EMT39682.1 NADH:ubiquinone oxidoreductase 27 kD subunit [Thermoanaerobacter thermohydrosulfuricus WC1]UZQ83058.1 NADH-quinone oxidoreductase subunit C [Thermoanaerobacter sp. RKWS2]SDG29408.1 NADH-quinone oxidoreductase subunit C [T